MSRCFPFPPPGYERKHRPEDLDILKEAKRKEKKHKKDKKDKERKKDKEKKEKDGSDEKHRDKKDRKKSKDKKEKHKDRKKEKDKGKDKEKSSISEESTVANDLHEKGAGNLHPKAHSKDGTSFFNDSKRSGLFHGENGAEPSQSSLPAKGNEGSKFVQELDRRIRDDEKGSGSQLSERVADVDKKDQKMAARPAVVRNSSGVLAEEKGGNDNKRVDRNMDPQGFEIEFNGNKMVHNLTPASKSKVEGISRPVDEHNERRLEIQEKYKETGGNKKGDKKRDRNKESHGKEKDMEKEKKRDDKAKSKTENKKSDHNKLKVDVRNDPGCDGGNNNTDLLKDTRGYDANEDNRKRKETYANGFLHESEIRPNKKQKPAPQLIENGRKLELLQTPTESSHDNHAAVPNSFQALNRNSLTNGAIEVQKPSSSMSNSSAPIMGSVQLAEQPSKILHRDSNYLSKAPPLPKTDDSILHRDSNYLNKAQPLPKMNDSNDSKKACPVLKVEDLIAETSRKPPHPDSKYLAEVLRVPNEVDWCEIDDLDWLVSKKDPSRKPTVESVGAEKDLRVWSEAVHIDSADVCALPYVIPY